MKKFTKQAKNSKLDEFYFGEYDELDIGISYVKSDKEIEEFDDKKHYHKTGTEYYFVVEGQVVLGVGDEEVVLDKEEVLQVDKKEMHKVKSVTKAPFKMVVFNTEKDNQDKIIVN